MVVRKNCFILYYTTMSAENKWFPGEFSVFSSTFYNWLGKAKDKISYH